MRVVVFDGCGFDAHLGVYSSSFGGKGLAEVGTKWCRACGGTGQLWRLSDESSGALVSQSCLFCGGKGVIVAEREEQF